MHHHAVVTLDYFGKSSIIRSAQLFRIENAHATYAAYAASTLLVYIVVVICVRA